MAFWGVEVKSGRPITHSCENAKGRLRISQATLGLGELTDKSVVQCNVGSKRPVLICILVPGKSEFCHLDLEFEEAEDVVFSVLGPRSVYLTGYYVRKSRKLNSDSDTEETHGVDIENTQSGGSSYRSGDDKYDDSFIDDDNDLEIPAESPVSGSKGESLENDSWKERDEQLNMEKHLSLDDDGGTQETADEDGNLLSVTDADEAIAMVLQDIRNTVTHDRICSDDSEKKVNHGIPDRASGRSLNEESVEVKNKNYELPTEKTPKESSEAVLTSYVNLKDIAGNQNTSKTSDIDQMGSPDPSGKPKRKRKERSKKEKTSASVDKDPRDDDSSLHLCEADASSFVPPSILGSDISPKPKRKRLLFDGTLTNDIDSEGSNVPKADKLYPEKVCLENQIIDKGDEFEDSFEIDTTVKDAVTANGEFQEHNDNNVSVEAGDSEPGKSNKKNTNITAKGKIETKTNVCDVANHPENSNAYVDQTKNQKRTLPNGLIIEDLISGPPDGRVAKPGRKVTAYYTGTLKDNGQIFDTKFEKTPCQFILGDEELFDGWNMGIEGMRVGGKRRVIIPPSLGFGDVGNGGLVLPGAWIVYDIEVIGVRRLKKKIEANK